MDYFMTLNEALSALGAEFKDNELAYLALTSKPEFVIRDRLAFKLFEQKFVVAREWNRIDLAILVDRGAHEVTPEVLLQLKAKSSFRLLYKWQEVFENARADVKKCAPLRSKSTRAFFLMIAPHIENSWRIDESLQGVLKYWCHWDWSLSGSALEKRVNQLVVKTFTDRGWRVGGTSDGLKIPAGEAFGARVSILYWLCEPL